MTADLIRQTGARLGFDRVGIAAAGPIARGDYLRRWLTLGRAGQMAYLYRNLDKRMDPSRMLPGARSIIVVAMSYRPAADQASRDAPTAAEGLGRIARYAWGRDYHEVLRERLRRFVEHLRSEGKEPFDARICVDTAPIVEREIAEAAGIGWIGKNTLVLHERLGSYLFLGEIITTLALEPDGPVANRCGSCTACLDACPTGALVEPHRMDASRCISYLTIEHRGEIPDGFREPIGPWLYGCDVCQVVCPFNRKAPATREPAFAPRPPAPAVPPGQIEQWTLDDYRRATSGRAMRRANLEMLRRNARIVQRNIARDPSP